MTEIPERTRLPTRRSLGLGLFIAPAAFLIVAGLNFVIAPVLCATSLGQSGLFRALVFALSLAGVLAAVWGVYLAYRNASRASAAGAQSEDAPRFLGVGGIMLSVLFVALTIIAGLSALAFRTCQPV